MGKEALKSVFDLIKQSPNRNYRLLAKIETGVRGWVVKKEWELDILAIKLNGKK